MKSVPYLLPLPEKFINVRNQLRVVGFELVRYPLDTAKEEANRYNHPTSDYEYAIHEIRLIDEHGQIYISYQPNYCSESRVLDYANYFISKGKAQRFSLKDILANPADFGLAAFCTLISPPYSLTLFGLAELSEFMTHREQKARARELGRFKELPLYWPPISSTKA